MTDTPETSAPEESESRRSLTERGLAPLWKLRDEIDELFEDVYASSALDPLRRRFGGGLPGRASTLGMRSPAVDMVEKDDEIRVTVELPGLHMKDIDVQVSDSTLTISGEKQEEVEKGDKAGEYYLSERRYGAFRRSFRLPEGVDRDAVKASFANGVLTVRLPKKAEAKAQARKVEVKPGG